MFCQSVLQLLSSISRTLQHRRWQRGHRFGLSAASLSRIADQDLLDLRCLPEHLDIFAYLLDCFIEFILASACYKNIGAFFDELLCCSEVYTAVSTCDHCDFSVKSFCN